MWRLPPDLVPVLSAAGESLTALLHRLWSSGQQLLRSASGRHQVLNDERRNTVLGGRLLIGACGSAAVVSLPMYISALRGQFTGTITVLMTHTATVFLPPHTVALFADRVVTGEWPTTWPTENHATLVEGHDMLAVLSATANMLSAAATGAAPTCLPPRS